MINSTDIFTQGLNFMSAAQGRVDPRTGLFFFNFDLGTLAGNTGRGPGLPLSLRYSPMLTADPFHLGTGMSFGLSSFEPATHRLTLKTGETYTMENSTVRQKKLDVFRVKLLEGDKYQITYKTGDKEILSQQPDASLYLPVEMESPSGLKLALTWDSANRLQSVTDSSGKQLCYITYDTFSVTVTLWPDAGKETVNVILDKTHLGGDPLYVNRIRNISLATPLIWSLEYTSDKMISDRLLLCKITAPTGLTENAHYNPEAIRVNDALGMKYFPGVVLLETTPATGIQETTRWRYTDASYLGGDRDAVPYTAGDDVLYGMATDYSYGSEETHIAPSGQPDQHIKRTYNSYHLLVREEQWEGNTLEGYHATETTYPVKANTPFDEQPTVCQMPVKKTETWRLKSGDVTRSEVTLSDYAKDDKAVYEDSGNPTRQVSPNGTITEMTYYPAGGESGKCPPEPDGFPRFMKSRTVYSPVSAEYKDEPAHRTEYTYISVMPSADAGDIRPVILQKEAVHYTGILKSGGDWQKGWAEYQAVKTDTEAFTWDTSKDNFGRMKTRTVTHHADNRTGPDHVTLQEFTFTPDGNVLQQDVKTTVTCGSEKKTLQSSRTQSALTGHKLSETDEAGNQVSYKYDALGRLLKQLHHTEAGADEYKSEETWSYTLPAGDDPAYTVHTDIFGNRTRTGFDGLGRMIKQEFIMKTAGAQNDDWQPAHTRTYDPLGRCVSSASSDVLPDTTGAFPAAPAVVTDTRTAAFDAWGQVNAVTQKSSGVVSHTDMALQKPAGGEGDGAIWTTTTFATGNDGKNTASRVVYHDAVSNLPVKTEVFLPGATTPYSTTSQKWDGARRLRERTDEQGYKTQWSYDIYGRILATTYADGAVVKKQYAPFSSAALPVSISITPKDGDEMVCGTQSFDALGRLLTTASGGRRTVMTYKTDWQTVPSTITGPDGVTQTNTTDPKLGEVLTALNATAENGSSVAQTFGYNKSTGQLKDATGTAGNGPDSISTWRYGADGRPRGQKQNTLGGGELDSTVGWTPGGALQQYTGVDGSVRTRTWYSSGQYTGRVKHITDGEVTVVPEYDALMRVRQWTTTDGGGGNSQVTTVTLDDLGRERVRVLTVGGKALFTIKQTWSLSHQIKTRTRYAGDGKTALLTESFDYDSRMRLKKYTAEGHMSDLPQDAYGNPLTQQTFTFDVLNNIRECVTTLGDGKINTATYHFDNEKDPCQLTSVTNTLTDTKYGYPVKTELKYDAAGRMITDERGRTLTYDALGRLASVTPAGKPVSTYGYDAHNRLAWQTVKEHDSATVHRLYYHGGRLVNEWLTPEGQAQARAQDKHVRLVYAGGCVAQVDTEKNVPAVMLTGTDSRQSVIAGTDSDGTKAFSYSAYGIRAATEVPANNNTEEKNRCVG
ncbi:RHS repeat domain-containing protein [Enterobacter bugandensis]|uniref:RHS repeat domain-containing protein n=1 Tax=Enterobacter bugandensis TaxID=881260 RepID=UPI00066935B1|nr:RHS repeat protein [Enterobacter bugandensis]